MAQSLTVFSCGVTYPLSEGCTPGHGSLWSLFSYVLQDHTF